MSTSSDTPAWLEPVIVSLLLINYFILLPSSGRFIKSSWSIRDEPYMNGRKIKLTVICAFFLLLIITIHPLLLYLYFWPISESLSEDIIGPIIHILVIELSIIPLTGVALRIWLFHFKRKFNEATFKQKRVEMQNEKKEALFKTRERVSVSPFVSPKAAPTDSPKLTNFALDRLQSNTKTLSPLDTPTTPVSPTSYNHEFPSPTTYDTQISSKGTIRMESLLTNPMQFWIDNKNRWGNIRFLRYFVAIFFILDIAIITVCTFILNITISYAIQTVIYLSLLIFIQYHVSKISPLRDEFFVKKQFKTESYVIYFNFFVWIITFCLWYPIKTDDDADSYEGDIDSDSARSHMIIAIRFLLDGNMTITCFALIIAQFAVPWFKFTNNMERLSSKHVLQRARMKRRKIKIPLVQFIGDREGYYLFLEYLVGEMSVENLLFITEVAFMKQKFEKSVVAGRPKSPSTSIAASVKNAFSSLVHRGSRDESVSKSLDVAGTPRTSKKAAPIKSVTRLSKLRDIPSDGAIMSTQSEVENILNKSAKQLNDEIEENKYNDNASDIEESIDSQLSKKSDHSDMMMEMGVINGKRLTISKGIMNTTTNSTANVIKNAMGNSKVTLPKLPHSVTMVASMKQNNLFDSVDMIYDNFVRVGSEYEVNISSSSRYTIRDLVLHHRSSVERQRKQLETQNFSDSTIDVNIFDEAASEILGLLKSSFLRFTLSKPYKVYCNAMKEQKK